MRSEAERGRKTPTNPRLGFVGRTNCSADRLSARLSARLSDKKLVGGQQA